MSPIAHALIRAARRRMRTSRDPMHDHAHSDRVVRYARALAIESNRSAVEIEALTIAADWHDVARIKTKNPSFLWMPMIDDMLSACMLWRYVCQKKLQGETTSLAVRLIVCKGMGTGAILTRLLFAKDARILVDLLKDADNLDVLAIPRVEWAIKFIEASRLYHVNYRVMCWWFGACKQLKVRTEAAKKYIIRLLEQLIAWLKQPAILLWHIAHYGKAWAHKNMRRLERLLASSSPHACVA